MTKSFKAARCETHGNPAEILQIICANIDPQRDRHAEAWRRRASLFIRQPADPSDMLDRATREIASASKLGVDATKKLPGEGFKRPWPPLIKMDAAVKARVEKLFNP